MSDALNDAVQAAQEAAKAAADAGKEAARIAAEVAAGGGADVVAAAASSAAVERLIRSYSAFNLRAGDLRWLLCGLVGDACPPHALMSVTNAISSVIVVGALLAVGVDMASAEGTGLARAFGFIALILASVNIFGGFMVTQRMLAMYKKKER